MEANDEDEIIWANIKSEYDEIEKIAHNLLKCIDDKTPRCLILPALVLLFEAIVDNETKSDEEVIKIKYGFIRTILQKPLPCEVPTNFKH